MFVQYLDLKKKHGHTTLNSIRERIEDTDKIEIVNGENEKIQATGDKKHMI